MDISLALSKLLEIAATVVIQKAITKVGVKKRESAFIAKAIVTHPDFSNLNKGDFVYNPEVFKEYLQKIKRQNVQIDSILTKLEENPEIIGKIQKHILENPFIPQKRSPNIERRQFLILGHSHAGKTCYLFRLLYYLAFHHKLRILMSYKDTTDLINTDERFVHYDDFLSKLTTYNTTLNMGEIFGETLRSEKIYIDIEFLQLNTVFRLELFDYSGQDILDMEAFKNLIAGKEFDGILVLVDTYHLLAKYFREQAFKHKMLDEKKFVEEEKLKKLVDNNIKINIDHGPRIALRIQHALRRKIGVPISYIFTKFDSFELFHTNDKEIGRLLQKSYQNSILQIANTQHYSISLGMISAFGKSRFKHNTSSEGFEIDDKYTGLPIFLPEPNPDFDGSENIALPFLFLIQNHIQNELSKEIQAFKDGFARLPFWTRIKYNKHYREKLRELGQRKNEWQPKSDKEKNFLLINQYCEDPEKTLSEFFNA